MEFLKLPIVKISMGKEKYLSMDEYLKFILANLRYTVRIGLIRKLKKRGFVYMRFALK